MSNTIPPRSPNPPTGSLQPRSDATPVRTQETPQTLPAAAEAVNRELQDTFGTPDTSPLPSTQPNVSTSVPAHQRRPVRPVRELSVTPSRRQPITCRRAQW
jgi:hypothetical protein